jgi:hypothetical protein
MIGVMSGIRWPDKVLPRSARRRRLAEREPVRHLPASFEEA